MGKKCCFISTMSALLPSLHSSWLGGKAPAKLLLREGKSRTTVLCSKLLGAAQEANFSLTWLKAPLWMPGGHWKEKQAQLSCCRAREPAVPQTHTKTCKRLQPPEKETVKSVEGAGGFHTQRGQIPIKGLRCSQNLQLGWLVNIFPSTKPVCIQRQAEVAFFFPKCKKITTKKKAHEETGKLPNQRNTINLHKLAKNKWRSMNSKYPS